MPIGVQTKLLINNHFVNSVAGKTFKTANPSDESVCVLSINLRAPFSFKP